MSASLLSNVRSGVFLVITVPYVKGNYETSRREFSMTLSLRVQALALSLISDSNCPLQKLPAYVTSATALPQPPPLHVKEEFRLC